jgi:hypothetical protein
VLHVVRGGCALVPVELDVPEVGHRALLDRHDGDPELDPVTGARSRVLRRRDPADGGRPAEGEVGSRRSQAAGSRRLALTGLLAVRRLAGLLPELVPEQAARPGTATAAMAQAAIRPGFMASP